MTARAKVCLKLIKALKRAPFELKRQPRRHLGFESASSVDEQLTLRHACVAVAPNIRVAGELDLSPDLLIVDYGLGAIGLVHIIEPGEGESIAEQAKCHVDQATYLRHLLMTRGVTAGMPNFQIHYTVECVLALRADLAYQMNDVVREIASKTRFLHATGLNLLPFDASFDMKKEELKRAFAWLLPMARQRLHGCACATTRLKEVELFNYRLPGRRPWRFGENRVHLLHGPNGTGKSSIAEALELAVTGSVERLKNNPNANYAEIIRNSESTGAPTVSISLSDGRTFGFQVNTTGIAETPLRPDLPATAFRLDQTVMDQLIRADSQQRARILTKAFFPGDAYYHLELAQEEFNKAYRELPLEIRQEIQSAKPDANEWPGAVVPRLGWIEAPEIPKDRIADCLPMKREQLEALGRIVPEITDSLKSLDTVTDGRELEANIQKLEEAIGRIRVNVRRYRDAVVESLAALGRVSAWAPSGSAVHLGYSELLRRWSDSLGLSDLLQKHIEISGTLRDARAAGWAPESEVPGLFATPPDSLNQSMDALSHAAEQCRNEQEDLFKQLQTAGGTTHVTGAPQPTTGLSSNEIANLNLTCGWFIRQEPTQATEPFGEVVQKAISENTSKGFGTLTVGAQGWTERPTKFLAALQPALDELLALEPPTVPVSPTDTPISTTEVPVYRSPLLRLHAYGAAVATARKVVSANQQVEQTLMNRLTEHKLNAALDEVIALFTPARWAYEGLMVDTKLQDGKVALDLRTSTTGSPAELRLNTAELNLVVLALYLMCGPTIENPLGTLILDDPLQNMDELTASTVARGMAKVAALFPPGWQLLLMFHGEEDLETFRREVPGSVYYLPWLGPRGAAPFTNNAVLRDSSASGAGAAGQSLDQVIRLNPRRPQKAAPAGNATARRSQP